MDSKRDLNSSVSGFIMCKCFDQKMAWGPNSMDDLLFGIFFDANTDENCFILERRVEKRNIC